MRHSGWWPFFAGAVLALGAFGYSSLRTDVAAVREEVKENDERVSSLARDVRALRTSKVTLDAGAARTVWPWPPSFGGLRLGAPDAGLPASGMLREGSPRSRSARRSPDYQRFD